MPVIDSQHARELAAKSHEARRRNKELRLMPEPDSQPITQIASNPITDEIARTRDQIEKLNDLIDDCTDPKEQDALTRAKDRQFRIWARLAQLPTDPKPTTAKPRRTEPMPEPTPAIPTPSTPAVPGASQAQQAGT